MCVFERVTALAVRRVLNAENEGCAASRSASLVQCLAPSSPRVGRFEARFTDVVTLKSPMVSRAHLKIGLQIVPSFARTVI